MFFTKAISSCALKQRKKEIYIDLHQFPDIYMDVNFILESEIYKKLTSSKFLMEFMITRSSEGIFDEMSNVI